MYQHVLDRVPLPLPVTITNFIFLKEMLSYQFMSITFFKKSGSDQSLKIDRFPRLLFLLTNPRCPFKTSFLPPCRCCHHFSPSQRVATRWSKCLGPLGSPHMSHVFERRRASNGANPSGMVPPCRSILFPLSNTHTACPVDSRRA